MASVDSIVARLTALHPKRIDLSLDRMWRILDALGHPERRLPPVIHVAGTNGKGSTVAFMRAMLEAAGKSVHVYTSPNLVRLNERFRLGRQSGGVLVGDDELAATLAECERANGEQPITVFEIETAAGLLLFSRHPADVLLLEVGLGGRPAVVSRQTEGPLSVIMARGEEVGAPLHVAGQDWVAGEERGRLVYQDVDGLLDLPPPRLFG